MSDDDDGDSFDVDEGSPPEIQTPPLRDDGSRVFSCSGSSRRGDDDNLTEEEDLDFVVQHKHESTPGSTEHVGEGSLEEG